MEEVVGDLNKGSSCAMLGANASNFSMRLLLLEVDPGDEMQLSSQGL